MTTAGVAGDIFVASGPAAYDPVTRTLTVAGSGSDPVDIVLEFEAAEAGTVTVSASAQPVSREHITWSQSPGLTPPHDTPCQVFATFRERAQETLRGEASASFVSAETPEEPADPEEPEEPTTPKEPDESDTPGESESSGVSDPTVVEPTTALAVTGASHSLVPLGIAAWIMTAVGGFASTKRERFPAAAPEVAKSRI